MPFEADVAAFCDRPADTARSDELNSELPTFSRDIKQPEAQGSSFAACGGCGPPGAEAEQDVATTRRAQAHAKALRCTVSTRAGVEGEPDDPEASSSAAADTPPSSVARPVLPDCCDRGHWHG
eukprot:6205592-Pleurochrysis_carterae.AAC.1